MTTLLRAEHISVNLDGRAALTDVSVDVGAGEWLCVVGPNGAGKSTLLRCLAGVQPMQGNVAAAGGFFANRRNRAAFLAYVPQQPLFPENMTVSDFVLLGRRGHLGSMGRESAHDFELASQAMVDLELTDFAARRLDALSGGERQRAVLAQALAQQTPLLILDEPTTGLDIGHRQQLLELLGNARRQRRLTIVMSMHDLQVAAAHAERLVLMHNGSIVTCGSPTKVLTTPHLSAAFDADVSVRWIGTECLITARSRALPSGA